MRRLTCILTSLIYLSCCLTAQERTDSVPATVDDGGDLVISIVTCDPGPDIYELCGHAAIRIRNEKMDSVWNYGIFDFTSPNFIYRFCKGETDYMLYSYPFGRFMGPYVRRGSTVREQVLDLSQEEARALRDRLRTEALPENRVYRYNYVRDNCATRPWKRVTESVQGSVELPDTLYFPTFRQEMRHFHRAYPWYQFGIDLVLGSGLDYPLIKDEDIFAPPVLAAKLANAVYDGRPLVKEIDIIFRGLPDATLPPTPWYKTPMACGIYMLLLSFGAVFAYFRSGCLWRWWISIYFFASGVCGCIVWFLVFLSEHEATSPNLMMLWLNPFQLVIAAGIWWKSWRNVVRVIAIADIALIPLTALLLATPLSVQTANPAVWCMMVSGFLLALTASFALGAKKVDTRLCRK